MPLDIRHPFTTRAATPADALLLAGLVNSAYRGNSSRAGWTTEADLLGGLRIDEARLTSSIAALDNVVLVHEVAGAIVACVHLQRTGDDCYLGMLTVQPTRQAAGLGRAMLDAAERWAVQHWHSRSMSMTVIVQRTELIAWYERRGYVKTGELKAFPYGDERWGLPTRPDLAFHVMAKTPLVDGSEDPSLRTARPTTNDQPPTTNDQRLTTNDQRLTTNDQRPTTNDQRPTRRQ